MYKKITTLLLAIVFYSLNIFSQAPSFVWAKNMGGTNFDRPNCVISDASNDAITGGSFFGTSSDFDPGPSTYTFACFGALDGFISKLDLNGNFVWAKQLRTTTSTSQANVIGLTIDASGNILATGQFGGTVDFDPGVGTYTMTCAAMTIFILKLDPNGNFIWAKQMTGASGTSAIEGEGIVTDAANNIYTAGRFNTTVDFDPGPGTYTFTSLAGSTSNIFISKLDVNGNFVWAKQIGGNFGDLAYGIDLDASNNVYTTGYYTGVVDFDPGPGTFTLSSAGGSSDVFVCKLDVNGNFVWANSFGDAVGSDAAKSIVVDPAGFVYTSGDFSNTVDFDSGVGTFTMSSAGLRDIFISKLDLNGNFVWAKQLGGASDDNGYGLAKDFAGNIYTTGQFQSTADFDPGVGTSNLTSAGSSDVFISKLNSSGNFILAGQVGGVGGDRGEGVVVTGSGHIYVTGFFRSGDFDPGVGTYTMVSAGGGTADDIFVLKLASCSTSPSQPTTISGLNSFCSGAGSTSYSIAIVAGATSYTWSLPSGWSGSSTTNTISATTGTASGNISVSAVNACGTSSASVLSVTVNPLPIITVNSGTICAGNSFTMSPSGATSYTYSGGSAIVSPTANATYSVSGTSAAGCVSASPAISNVTVNALPTINASTTNTLMCTGQTVTLTASGASTYTWSPGGAGTSIVVSPTVSATYTINGTSAQGCNNSSTFTQSVSACTGIESNGLVMSSEVETYPNPSNGIINLKLSKSETSVIAEIFDVQGKKVLSTLLTKENSEIDLSKESNGIYFLKITTSKGPISVKIIKQ